MSKKLSNQELKGTSDWFPEEFLLRKYIFDTWRKVCLRYGFEEYLSPLLESADIYRAKSGEDIGGKELLVFRDLGNRELAVRPEMTPSVVRMVSKTYRSATKPLKYFSIANFFRNEKPQRGRNREFWQLNCDIFGSNDLRSDEEILKLALDIVLEFDPPADSFVLKINSRKLLEALFSLFSLDESKKLDFFRILDKRNKLKTEDFNFRLESIGLNKEQIKDLNDFMLAEGANNFSQVLKKYPAIQDSYDEIKGIINSLSKLGYADLIEFDPGIIRGFDYYDGIVFEVLDRHPDNNRAMFGGGRYNGLANIFGEDDFPAIGFAPGDESMRIFLESWGMVDEIIKKDKDLLYLPLLSQKLIYETDSLAKKLRLKNENVLIGFEEQKLSKALDFANKKKANKVVIFAEEEFSQGVYKIKDMKTGKEEVFKI